MAYTTFCVAVSAFMCVWHTRARVCMIILRPTLKQQDTRLNTPPSTCFWWWCGGGDGGGGRERREVQGVKVRSQLLECNRLTQAWRLVLIFGTFRSSCKCRCVSTNHRMSGLKEVSKISNLTNTQPLTNLRYKPRHSCCATYIAPIFLVIIEQVILFFLLIQ